MSKKLKNIGVVSLLTSVSRVLGLVRDQLAAAIFGASLLNSAFVTAFRLPNLFRRLLGEGSLTAAFLPTLQEELHLNSRPGAFALLNKVVSWLAIITGAVVVVAMLVFSQSRRMTGQDDKWYLVADLSVILFPYLAFVCIAAAFNATLNVFQRFTEPALSPIWLFASTPLGEIHWLCAGVLLGGFLQMTVPAVVLMREGWRPRLDLRISPRVREIAALMAPGFFGSAIYQVNIYVGGLLAYAISDSASTLMYLANRLMELPIGVFAIAVSTVVYPLIAKHAVEKKFTAMAEDYRKGIRLILLINVPAAMGLALLSEPIIRVLFQHGKFDAADTHAMTPLLAILAVGMPFFSMTNLTVRAFYSVKDTKTPVKVAVIDFVVNLVLSLSLMHWLGAKGLVLASTAAIIVQTVLLKRALTRKLPEMRFAPLWPAVGKILGATLVMGLLVGGGWHGLQGAGLGARARDWLALGGLIPLSVVVYGGVLWLLRMEGREEFAALAGRIFGGKTKVS